MPLVGHVHVSEVCHLSHRPWEPPESRGGLIVSPNMQPKLPDGSWALTPVFILIFLYPPACGLLFYISPLSQGRPERSECNRKKGGRDRRVTGQAGLGGFLFQLLSLLSFPFPYPYPPKLFHLNLVLGFTSGKTYPDMGVTLGSLGSCKEPPAEKIFKPLRL